MPADAPTILATSIGLRATDRDMLDLRPGPTFDFAFDLAGRPDRPKLCYIGTATGDSIIHIQAYYNAFAGTDVRLTQLSLFTMPTVEDVRGHLLDQDVIWVNGGSTANMMAVWGVHGLGPILRECWEAGVVLGGVSAGSICWHVGGTTDSYGPTLRPVTGCLGLLPYSNGVHYNGNEQRRPLFHQLIGDGTLPDGYATDDGAGLYFRGTELAEAFAENDGAYGYRVERQPDGQVVETRLETRVLAP